MNDCIVVNYKKDDLLEGVASSSTNLIKFINTHVLMEKNEAKAHCRSQASLELHFVVSQQL